MTDRALDDLARRVLLDVIGQEYGDAIEELPEHDFSPAFERKMKRLIRRADHPIRYRVAQAAACLLLAALLSGCAVLTFVPEAKAAFSRWIKEVYETHIIYRYAGEGNDITASEGYRPTWIPNGYEEFYTSSSEYDFTVVYTNDIGQNLTFCYSTDMSGSA